MLIKKKSYKRNKKTGEIVKRQVVSVKCDDCMKEWETLYEYVKYRKLKKILCKSCRSKLNLKSQVSLSKRRWDKTDSKICIICSFCKKNIKKYPSLINKKNNFCNMRCRDQYVLKKYDILYDTFKKNIDEVSYLFGLILGDGHLRKRDQKNTTRVNISFNSKEVDMIELAKNIMNKLEINFYDQRDKSCNCLNIGFVLPDNLLKKYDMLWEGSKFNSNPFPTKKIINNINTVVGLINSDGCCKTRKGIIRNITFSNVTKSVYDAFIRCMDFHKISHTDGISKGRLDKRTGNKSKDAFWTYIGVKGISTIFKLKKYILKEEGTNCVN